MRAVKVDTFRHGGGDRHQASRPVDFAVSAERAVVVISDRLRAASRSYRRPSSTYSRRAEADLRRRHHPDLDRGGPAQRLHQSTCRQQAEVDTFLARKPPNTSDGGTARLRSKRAVDDDFSLETGDQRMGKIIFLAAEPYPFALSPEHVRPAHYRYATRLPRAWRLWGHARQRCRAIAAARSSQIRGCSRRGAPQVFLFFTRAKVTGRIFRTCLRLKKCAGVAKRQSVTQGRWGAFSFAAKPGTTSSPSSIRCRRTRHRQAGKRRVLRH